MRRHLVSVIGTAALVGVALLPAGLAARAEAQEFKEHFFLGAGLTYAEPDFADYNSTNRDAEATFGFDIRGGYRWRWVAAELDVQYYDGFDLIDSVTGQKGEMRGVGVGPNLKFYPFAGAIEPYALAGTGLLYFNDREDINAEDGVNALMRAGGGLQVELLPGVVAFGEGTYAFGIATKRDLIPIVGGLQFRF